MAERVEEFRTPRRSPRVNWAKWADGHKYKLRRGVDYDQDSHRARRAFISWTSRHGLHSNSDPDGDFLWIRAWPKADDQ